MNVFSINPATCAECGHRHAGPEVASICIGCPCEWRPSAIVIDIAAARALCEEATPDWRLCRDDHDIEPFEYVAIGPEATEFLMTAPTDADARFCAAAREGWPAALDEIERLRQRVAIRDTGVRVLKEETRKDVARLDELNTAVNRLRVGVCLDIIPSTFVACGEGGNYCSEACRLRAALAEMTSPRNELSVRCERLATDLAAMTAARDSACDGWDRCRQPNPYDKGDRDRIAALRAVGAMKP